MLVVGGVAYKLFEVGELRSMLAAKMAADVGVDREERWMTFDYAAEKKRVEQGQWPDGIPF